MTTPTDIAAAWHAAHIAAASRRRIQQGVMG
jgi:hypothetical protein